MNWGRSKTLISLILVTATNMGSGTALADSRFPSLDKSVRLHQAKELLGTHYDKSVVKDGEKFRHIEKFIFAQVKENLKDPWKPQARRLSRAIMNESVKYAFDPILLMAIIKHESVFDPETKGRYGEIGLMQVKPSTAQWISKKYDLKYTGAKSLLDPVVNVKFGAAYLDYLRDRFSSQSRLYLAAYNMGVTNVHRAIGRDNFPKEYPIKVMHQYIAIYSDLIKTRTPETKPAKAVVLADKDTPTPY